MVKRLFWLMVGMGLGVALTLRARVVVRRSVQRYVPDPIARRLRDINAAIEARQREIRARKSAPHGEARPGTA